MSLPRKPKSSYQTASAHLRTLWEVLELRRATAEQRQHLRFHWGSHVPDLARTLGRVMKGAAPLFSWALRGGAELLSHEDEVRELQELRALLLETLMRVDDTLFLKRRELYDDVMDVVSGARRLLEDPKTPPAQRAEVAHVFLPVEAILDTYNAGNAGVEPPAAPVSPKADALERASQPPARVLRAEPQPPKPPSPPAPRRRGRDKRR